MAQLFPWLESQKSALAERVKQNYLNRDIALVSFFELLHWFRRVLLQDAALLYVKNPQFHLWRYAPFSSVAFHDFAYQAQRDVAKAERDAALALQRLPENIVESMRGVVSQIYRSQEEQHSSLTDTLVSMRKQIDGLKETFDEVKSTDGGRRKKTKSM